MATERLTPRDKIRQEISEIPSIVEGDPRGWWRRSARLAIGFKNKLRENPDERVKEYFEPYVNRTLGLLRASSRLGDIPVDGIIDDAEINIMTLSREMASQFERTASEIETYFVPLDELVSSNPERFQTEDRIINGVNCRMLRILHPKLNSWYEVPLPINEQIWHKGGPARATLDVFAGSPESMQESEFPWNDYDVITAGNDNISKTAISIGVDPEGIEPLGSPDLNFQQFCLSRDTDQNQICLGADGLYYSKDAFEAATTGHIRTVGVYSPHRAIYGLDKTSIGRTEIATPRGLMRLVKAVVEGKALSFDYKPINANTDMGIYILFLARKWEKRENFPELLQKMYYLLSQMHQVREGESNIFDVLERAHVEYPFFDFGKPVDSLEGLIRWKTNKLVRQIDREAGWALNLPANFKIVRKQGDKSPILISLTGFTPDDSQVDTNERWYSFRNRSDIRKLEYNTIERDPYDRLFSKVKFDNGPDVFDESEFEDED